MAQLLYAVVLIAAQTAVLSHQHPEPATPAGAASQVCEFCTGFQAAAPPPATATVAAQLPVPLAAAPGCEPVPPRSHPACAGLSRAPPAFRSL